MQHFPSVLHLPTADRLLLEPRNFRLHLTTSNFVVYDALGDTDNSIETVSEIFNNALFMLAEKFRITTISLYVLMAISPGEPGLAGVY